MAATETLGALVEAVRLECGDSLNSQHQPDWVAIIKRRLLVAQRMLWLTHLWPHLSYSYTVPLLADVRYYSPPIGDLEPEGIRRIDLRYGGVVEPDLCRGIGGVEFGQFDSDAGATGSPAMRWDIRQPVAGQPEQIEVWPIPPASNDQALIVWANQSLRPFADDGDTSTLDGTLLSLAAAAELLAARESKSAGVKKAAAEQYAALLIGRTHPRTNRPFAFGAQRVPVSTGPRAPRY